MASSNSGQRGNNVSRQGYNKSPGYNSHPRAEKDLQEKEQMKQKWKSDSKETFHYKRLNPVAVSLKSEFSKSIFEEISKHINDIKSPLSANLDEIVKKSFNFWERFASDTARVYKFRQRGCSDDKLQKCLDSVYPILHQSTGNLLVDFLFFKKTHGTDTEKKIYNKLNLVTFVDRLIRQRPLSFLGANDQYLLRDSLKHGYGGFDKIGSDHENYPLVLEDYISYDEMRLAALISLSSWSLFVNNGTRKNYGKLQNDGNYQEMGVIVGQVGARLKKEGVMEYLDCVISRDQNIAKNGFGLDLKTPHVNDVWRKFWKAPLLTFEEATDFVRNPELQKKYNIELMPISNDIIFNLTIYKKRIAITAEILLCEANTRAANEGKRAYIHVVGLGLGVWKATQKQEQFFIEAWGDALEDMSDTKNIAFIDFSYIDQNNIKGVRDGQKYKQTGITIKFSKRNLHDKVPDDCILVCNYAWDGNSYPGNEFYLEKICSTGDSAAACSSMVAEVHNWSINPVVSGGAMQLASEQGYLRNCRESFQGNKGNKQSDPKPSQGQSNSPQQSSSHGSSVWENKTNTNSSSSHGPSVKENKTNTSSSSFHGPSVKENKTNTSSSSSHGPSVKENKTNTSSPSSHGPSVKENKTNTSSSSSHGPSVTENKTITSSSSSHGPAVKENKTNSNDESGKKEQEAKIEKKTENDQSQNKLPTSKQGQNAEVKENPKREKTANNPHSNKSNPSKNKKKKKGNGKQSNEPKKEIGFSIQEPDFKKKK